MSTGRIDLGKMLVNGTDARKTFAELSQATTSITMTETITGASSVEIVVQDSKQQLLRSGLLTQRSTLVLDNAGFELAGVNKTGYSLRLIFEDLAVAKLRRQDSFRKISAGHMSRAEFVTDLVRRDASWIKVVTTAGPNTKVELSRGTAKTKDQAAQPEDTWTAANRIMGEIQWRVWARRGKLYLLPDTYLRKQAPIVLSEGSPGIDWIDLDYDVGKPTATATITGRAGFRTLAPGDAVQLERMGPGDRIWLVESISRDPATTQVSVSLVLPKPTLPEPKDAEDGNGDDGEDGWDDTNLPEDPDLDTGSVAADADVEKFVTIALAQRGKPYVWGASGPGSFDCSGLVQYSAARAGFKGISKPVSALYATCKSRGKLISVSEAIRTRGAILIRLSGSTNHVAISLGNGRTMEAMGRAYGCRIGKAAGRFEYGGLLPGMFGVKRAPKVPVRPDDGNIPIGS